MKKEMGTEKGDRSLEFYLVAAGAGVRARTGSRSKTAVKGGEWVSGAPGRRAGWGRGTPA